MPETNNVTPINEAPTARAAQLEQDQNQSMDIANEVPAAVETTMEAPAAEVQGRTLTRKQRLGRTAAAAGLAVAGGVAMFKGVGLPEVPQEPQPEAPIVYADQNTEEVTVLPGEGVLDIIERVYGDEVPEGEARAIQDSPTFDAEYQAVLDQNGGDGMLHEGQVLHLPVDFYTEDELRANQQNQ